MPFNLLTRNAALLASGLLASCCACSLFAASPTVMPWPSKIELGSGRFELTGTFSHAFANHNDPRLAAGLSRALRRLEERTGLQFPREAAADAASAQLLIDCSSGAPDIPRVGDDESYRLEIQPAKITLQAANGVGILRGVETLLQLLDSDAKSFGFPAASIEDRPRFVWRGLMIDVARHWQPIEVIKRHLDGMAVTKLNVFHFHLTEDQGFRVESKKYPKLHQLGSDGNYFTQDQIREIIAYAADRGIRVVPEFDIPGHATSWLVGHPELASQPGPYKIERKWGIFQPVLDPTNEAVYTMLDGFLGEMAALFPDPYLHIGGDEVEGKHWKASERIQKFAKDNNLKDNEALQAHFNKRVLQILTKHGKRMIGWDEIFHPDLPKDAMIHSWRGAQSLAAAAQQGYAGILSNGYYIDLIHPTHEHYLNDPLPANTPLTPEQQQRVLGGEATMWSEWVTPETIDSRVWPRTAAIAERLWSRQDVRDVKDMYRRLPAISRRLEEAGLFHERNVAFMLQRFAGDSASPADLAALRLINDAVEPVKKYRRGGLQKGSNQFTPLTAFVDVARPDSTLARDYRNDVETYLFAVPTRATAQAESLVARANEWKAAVAHVRAGLAHRSPRVADLGPLFQKVDDTSVIAQEALAVLKAGKANSSEWAAEKLQTLGRAFEPHGPVELVLVDPVRLLVAAAAIEAPRDVAALPEWRKKVETLAFPPKPEKPKAEATAH